MNIFGEVSTGQGSIDLKVEGDLEVGGNITATCIDAEQYKEKGIDCLLMRTDASNNLACGLQAGLSQGSCSIALGCLAGQDQGNHSIALGHLAATSQPQGSRAITIGSESTKQGQDDGAIAIGYKANESGGQGDGAIAIGKFAGQSTNQGARSVAIGVQAGQTNLGVGAVAIGFYAGRANADADSIAIGNFGTVIASQPAKSIQVGALSRAAGIRSISIGPDSRAGAADSVVLGNAATSFSNSTNATVIGANSTITAGTSSTNNVVLGANNTIPSDVENSITIGTGITNTASDEMVTGGASLKRLRPSEDDACDLASETKRFKHAYLSSGATVKSLSNVGTGQLAKVTFDGQINRAAGLQWTTFASFDDWRIGRPYNGGADANHLLTISHEATSGDDPSRTNYLACDSTAGTVDLLSNTFRSDKTLNGYTIGGGFYRQHRNPLVTIDSLVLTSIFNNGGITFTPEQMTTGSTYQLTAIGPMEQDEKKDDVEIFVEVSLGASILVLHSFPIGEVTGFGSYTFDFTLNFAQSDLLSNVWTALRFEVDTNDAMEDVQKGYWVRTA